MMCGPERFGPDSTADTRAADRARRVAGLRSNCHEKTTHLHFRTANDWIRRHNQITYNIAEKQWKDNSSAETTDFIESILSGEDQQLIYEINKIVGEDLPEKK